MQAHLSGQLQRQAQVPCRPAAGSTSRCITQDVIQADTDSRRHHRAAEDRPQDSLGNPWACPAVSSFHQQLRTLPPASGVGEELEGRRTLFWAGVVVSGGETSQRWSRRLDHCSIAAQQQLGLPARNGSGLPRIGASTKRLLRCGLLSSREWYRGNCAHVDQESRRRGAYRPLPECNCSHRSVVGEQHEHDIRVPPTASCNDAASAAP